MDRDLSNGYHYPSFEQAGPGSFGNDNENGGKVIEELFSKTTTFYVNRAVLLISLPSLNDYEATRRNFLILRFLEGVDTRQQLSFSFSELRYSALEFNSREIFQHLTKLNEIE